MSEWSGVDASERAARVWDGIGTWMVRWGYGGVTVCFRGSGRWVVGV